MKTGLFFGSFNPIHIGHLAIANYCVEFSDLEEIWFVVSPQNPFKHSNELIPLIHRMEMVEIAIRDFEVFKATDFEKDMTLPTYTYRSLQHLKAGYPDRDFVLIIGGDNAVIFSQWLDCKKIISEFEVWAYPRLGYYPDNYFPEIKRMNAPIIEISSTFIRDSVHAGCNMKYFLPSNVFEYINAHNL